MPTAAEAKLASEAARAPIEAAEAARRAGQKNRAENAFLPDVMAAIDDATALGKFQAFHQVVSNGEDLTEVGELLVELLTEAPNLFDANSETFNINRTNPGGVGHTRGSRLSISVRWVE